MSITSISRDTNNNVSLVRMQVTDNMASVSGTDYILNNQDDINNLNGGEWSWFITDMLLVACSDGNAFYQFTNSTFDTLVQYGDQGSGMINPGLINQLAYYSSNGSTLSGLATGNNGVLITANSGVPSISSTLPVAVQDNITNVGTITSGTWNGTPVTVPYGGTGNTTFTAYGVLCAGTTATGTLQNVSGLGTTGYVLTSNGAGALPTWQASSGSGTVNTGTANDLAFYSSTGTAVSPLTSGNNGVLVTSGLGVPSISSTLPGAVQGNITALGTIATGVWNGTVIGPTYGGTGVNNGASTITIGGNVAFSGAFTFAGTITGNTAVTFPTSGTLATTSQIPSLPLSLANGGTNANLTASNGGIFYSTASAGAILAGTATANQILLSGASTTPVWSTATYPATTTINQLLYSSSANVIGGVTAGNYGVLISSSAGVPSWLANGTTGQILTATTSGTPSWASPAASGFTWNDVSGTTQAAVANNGYIISNASQTTVTIPATVAEGAVFGVQGKGSGGWILQMNTGQTCHFGNVATSSAGSLTNTNQWDSVQLVCVTANTTFAVIAAIGNLTAA